MTTFPTGQNSRREFLIAIPSRRNELVNRGTEAASVIVRADP